MTTYTRARTALIRAATSLKGEQILDPRRDGYVRRIEDNLLDGVRSQDFERDFARGAGHELDRKMCAVYSSSALAVNTFAPWKKAPGSLSLGRTSAFDSIVFEQPCPSGLGGTPPHLDVLASSETVMVAVESKCLEFLKEPKPHFSPSYDRISDLRSRTGWFKHIAVLRAKPETYQFLDAAQLIKHYLGLAHCYASPAIKLLYLFWEPVNAGSFSEFAEHRDEIERFKQAVGDSSVAFEAMSCLELWQSWLTLAKPVWVKRHVKSLRDRYAVRI